MMNNTELTTTEETIKAYADPIIIEDQNTLSTVNSQIKVNKIIDIAVILLSIAYTISSIVDNGLSWFVLVLIGFGFIYYLITAFIANILILLPMRFFRFRACVKRMRELPQPHMHSNKWASWNTPFPAVLTIDSARKLLFLDSEHTKFRGLVLTPNQISDVKIEREQTIHTDTNHSSSMGFLTSFGLMFMSGGSSKSKTKVIETAFLEISYVLDNISAPKRAVFPFGTDRRSADDWAVAIKHMCQQQ